MKMKVASSIIVAMIAIGAAAHFMPWNKPQNEQIPVDEGIKNVILLIPDGGGYGNFDLANDVKLKGGFLTDDFPNRTKVEKGPMTMKSYLAGSAITLNYKGELTDSAAAGTAIATGKKTYNGRIGIDHEKKPVASILEAAQTLGKATGIVSTYEWMHATPASFTAHGLDRSDYKTLYKQIENQGVDVVLGSGYGAVSYHASIDNAINNGYKIIENKSDLEAVVPGDRLWGNATNNSSPFDIQLKDGNPTLEDMTRAAITALSGDKDGFFLMVEGSKVDTGGHSNDALVTTSEYLAFDAAFKAAVDFASTRKDTAVIAIPDHDTGAMKYDEIDDLYSAVVDVRTGVNPKNVQWGTTSHSTQNVGVWTYLPKGVSGIDGLSEVLGDTKQTRESFVIDNTRIAPFIAQLFGVDLDEVTEQLFVDVTDIGTYYSDLERFLFNEGGRSVYNNSSSYKQKGKDISLDGKVAFAVDDRFYVPKSMLTKEDLVSLEENKTTTVVEDDVPRYTIENVRISPVKAQVKRGQTLVLDAVVDGSGNPPQEVVFSIEEQGLSQGTSLDENGKLFVAQDEKNDALTVVVKAKSDGSKAAVCKIEIAD